MRIAMIGSGYVGLVSAACFADYGDHVTCVDNDTQKISLLQQGRAPIYEPGLEALIRKNTAQERLSFTSDMRGAIRDAQVVFIAVGTPARRGTGSVPDLRYVFKVAQDLGACLKDFTVVVMKSTVPVGTGDRVEEILRKRCPAGADVHVVSNPEFLREGMAINDFKSPDRLVIGVHDKCAREVMDQVYAPLKNRVPMIATTRRAAELIKYASNAFLAMKITYINQMADLCEEVGASLKEVAHGIGSDHRIGAEFLRAGPGFGGSCFPKDTRALSHTAKSHGVPMQLVDATIKANDARKKRMAARITGLWPQGCAGRTVCLLGLTFKPDTDDLRESPSLVIMEELLASGLKVRAYDPKGMPEAKKRYPEITMGQSPYDAVKNSDALVLLTEWDMFRALDLTRIAALMKGRYFVDLRNVYEPRIVEKAGLVPKIIGETPA